MANSPQSPAFPANLPSLTSVKVDGTTEVLAAHVNDIDDEVIAIAAVIGTGVGISNPTTAAGGYPNGTLHARLRQLEGTVQNTINASISGAFSGPIIFGGAGGNRVDFDGDTSFQGVRVSDGAAQPLWLNWFGGGRVHAKDLYTNDFYDEGTASVAYLLSRGDALVTGNFYTGGLGDFNQVNMRNGGASVGGVFDVQGLGTGNWSTYPLRMTATGGSLNTGIGFYAPAGGIASIFKYYAGTNTFQCRDGDDAAWIGIQALSFSPSSRRWKRNIQNMDYGLDEVMALRPVEYETDGWAPGKDGGVATPVSMKNVGLIAEETVDIIPEVVSIDEEGLPSGISYDNLVAVCIKAIQQQQQQIDDLKAEIAVLKG
jgi:hypothetical protein